MNNLDIMTQVATWLKDEANFDREGVENALEILSKEAVRVVFDE